VHKKNADVVEKAFKGEKGFGEALGRVSLGLYALRHELIQLLQACKQYCNHNAIATTTSRSPELLASYVNQVLSKGNKEASDDANMEESLNEAVRIALTRETPRLTFRLADDDLQVH
jgi:cullin 1